MVTYTGSGTNKKEKQTGWARRGYNGAVMARCERQYDVWNDAIDDAAAVSCILRPVTDTRVYFTVVPSREQRHTVEVGVKLFHDQLSRSYL